MTVPDRGRAAELDAADAHLDAIPRADADIYDVGPFTLFVGRSGSSYYARPRRPPGAPITSGDIDELAEVCGTRAVPLDIEWVCDLHPTLATTAGDAGLAVHAYALMVHDGPGQDASGGVHDVAGSNAQVRTRVVGADDPALVAGRAVAEVSFGHGGTDAGVPGPADRDRTAAGIRPAFVDHMRQRARSGRTVTVVAETDEGVVAVGSYLPVGTTAEIVAVATLPSVRHSGLGAAVTRTLLSHAAASGVSTVLLSAQNDDVERLYRSVGFRRIGTAGAAGPGKDPTVTGLRDPDASHAAVDRFLGAWLGAWPPAAGRVEVVASPRRDRPGWDGRPNPLVGVCTADAGMISVPPSRLDAVAAVADGLDPVTLRASRHLLAEAVGVEGRVIDGIFRWSVRPAQLDDAGTWLPVDDPRVPAWLKPFGGEALVALDDGRYVAGVGLKRHDPTGQEVAVVTEEAARGRGLARRLVTQATRRVVADGGVVVYLHAPDNLASAHVAEASGFPDLGWRIVALVTG